MLKNAIPTVSMFLSISLFVMPLVFGIIYEIDIMIFDFLYDKKIIYPKYNKGNYLYTIIPILEFIVWCILVASITYLFTIISSHIRL